MASPSSGAGKAAVFACPELSLTYNYGTRKDKSLLNESILILERQPCTPYTSWLCIYAFLIMGHLKHPCAQDVIAFWITASSFCSGGEELEWTHVIPSRYSILQAVLKWKPLRNDSRYFSHDIQIEEESKVYEWRLINIRKVRLRNYHRLVVKRLAFMRSIVGHRLRNLMRRCSRQDASALQPNILLLTFTRSTIYWSTKDPLLCNIPKTHSSAMHGFLGLRIWLLGVEAHCIRHSRKPILVESRLCTARHPEKRLMGFTISEAKTKLVTRDDRATYVVIHVIGTLVLHHRGGL